MKAALYQAKIVYPDQALRQADGQAFSNTPKFTLRDLGARSRHQQLRAAFDAYLDGFWPNVHDVPEEIGADILAVERETEGLLAEILGLSSGAASK